MTPEEDYRFMDAWIRAQAQALAPEVDETWTITQCVRVISAHIVAPSAKVMFDHRQEGAFQAAHYLESLIKMELPDNYANVTTQHAFNDIRSHLYKQQPDPRIGCIVEYEGEDSYYRGRIAQVIRKFNRVTGEHDGPERFAVQDDRGLLLIKNVKEVK